MRTLDTQINADASSTTPTLSITGTWHPDSEQTPVYAVIAAVADLEDTDPADLPPLHNAINPDALNRLFTARPAPTVTVEFQYAGYTITVHGTGEVQVQADQDR